MNLLLIGVLLALIAIAYQIGLSKSRKLAGQGNNSAMLHSRPGYYGALVALWCGLPAFLILMAWNIVEPSLLEQVVIKHLPHDVLTHLDQASLSVVIDRVQALASGFGVSDQPAAYELAAAEQLAKFSTIGTFAKLAVVISVALAGLVWAKTDQQEFSCTESGRKDHEYRAGLVFWSSHPDHTRHCDVDVWRSHAILQLCQSAGFLLWHRMGSGF